MIHVVSVSVLSNRSDTRGTRKLVDEQFSDGPACQQDDGKKGEEEDVQIKNPFDQHLSK